MTASNNAYFDLNDYVRSQTCVEVAAQMGSKPALNSKGLRRASRVS